MHIISTCERCGLTLEGDVFVDEQETEWMQQVNGVNIIISNTICTNPDCLYVNEIVTYPKELVYV